MPTIELLEERFKHPAESTAAPAVVDASSLPPRSKMLLNLAFVVGLALVAAVTTLALLGVRRPQIGTFDWLYPLAYMIPAGICVARGVFDRFERLPWILIGAAITCWAAGFAYFNLAFGAGLGTIPSLSDGFWLSFYPLVFFGLAVLVRRRVGRVSLLLGLDGLLAALIVTALAAAFILGPVFEAVGGSLPVAIAGVAYPVGDLLLTVVIFTVFAATGWRPGARWSLLAFAFGSCVVADSIYLSQVVNGTYHLNTLLDATWPLAMWIVSLAAWRRPARRATAGARPESPVWLPLSLGAVAIGLLVYGNYATLGSVATGLSIAALSVSSIAILFSLRDQRRLRDLIQRDPLTGLFNHRAFHEAVEFEIAANPDGRLGVLLADLDGFKQINDQLGHLEGDRVLREVAEVLKRGSRPVDLPARIGGDEFAVLLRGVAPGGAREVADRVQAELRASGLGIGMTIGVAEWPLDGPTKDLLLLQADNDLYGTKPEAADRRLLNGAAAVATMNGEGDRISGFLAIAREQLGMDVAYFSEFTDGHQVFRGLEGDANSFGMRRGEGIPLDGSYCMRVVGGSLPNVISDARSDERVNSLAATREANIGAYIGVPMRFSDGQLYGTLCCASHNPDPTLAQRDVDFMQVIARLLADQLERDERQSRERILETQALSLSGLLAALDARDRYTGEHSENVVRLARRVARQLGHSDEAVSEVEQVALLHDIGKIGIPDAILHKEGPLDDEEWRLMREHPEIGARLVATIEPLAHLAPMVRAEHERWDGDGYPGQLSGSEIPFASRIVFVCDAYHAMTSDRPYRAAMSPDEARWELDANRGTQFDPEVVGALARVLGWENANTTLPSRS